MCVLCSHTHTHTHIHLASLLQRRSLFLFVCQCVCACVCVRVCRVFASVINEKFILIICERAPLQPTAPSRQLINGPANPGAATNLICAFAHLMFMFPANAIQPKTRNSDTQFTHVDVEFALLCYEIAFQL